MLKSLGVTIEDVVVSPSYCGSYNKYAFYLKTRNRSFLFGEIMTPYVCSFSEDIILLTLCRMTFERIYEFVKPIERTDEVKSCRVCSRNRGVGFGSRFLGRNGFLGGFFVRLSRRRNCFRGSSGCVSRRSVVCVGGGFILSCVDGLV